MAQGHEPRPVRPGVRPYDILSGAALRYPGLTDPGSGIGRRGKSTTRIHLWSAKTWRRPPLPASRVGIRLCGLGGVGCVDCGRGVLGRVDGVVDLSGDMPLKTVNDLSPGITFGLAPLVYSIVHWSWRTRPLKVEESASIWHPVLWDRLCVALASNRLAARLFSRRPTEFSVHRKDGRCHPDPLRCVSRFVSSARRRPQARNLGEATG